jgi:hypothetical protein
MSAFSPSAAMPLHGLPRPAPARRRRVAAGPVGSLREPTLRTAGRDGPGLAWLAVLVVLLLEAAVLFAPHAMLVNPLQATVLAKRISGYAMFTLLAFAMGYGWLRRVPAMAAHLRALGSLHQASGLLILLLLGAHVGARPSGFLLAIFHAMAIALGAGAIRTALGRRSPRGPRGLSTGLLVLHITLACLVAAGALLHLYFVYAYTT